MTSSSIIRILRKGAVELVPVIAILVLDYFEVHIGELGLDATTGAIGLFVLLQVRRIIRDATKGLPE
jgi:hypothetical protein